jgi:hypothetical protein
LNVKIRRHQLRRTDPPAATCCENDGTFGRNLLDMPDKAASRGHLVACGSWKTSYEP